MAFVWRRITTGPLGVRLAARTEAPADPLTIAAPPLPYSWRDLPGAVITIAASTGGHVAAVERFSVTGALAR